MLGRCKAIVRSSIAIEQEKAAVSVFKEIVVSLIIEILLLYRYGW
jgi:hypothetical protein